MYRLPLQIWATALLTIFIMHGCDTARPVLEQVPAKALAQACTPEEAERCALTPGCTRCGPPTGAGGATSIGMSNFREKTQAITAYVVNVQAKSGRDINAWDPGAMQYTGAAWSGVADETTTTLLMEHATANPGENNCGPNERGRLRDGCHPAYVDAFGAPDTAAMVAAEVASQVRIIEHARTILPALERVILYNRSHNFCVTGHEQNFLRSPEPYAHAVTHTVRRVAAAYADSTLEVRIGTDLHELSRTYNNPSGEAPYDCTWFSASDGTHPSAAGASDAARKIEEDLQALGL